MNLYIYLTKLFCSIVAWHDKHASSLKVGELGMSNSKNRAENQSEEQENRYQQSSNGETLGGNKRCVLMFFYMNLFVHILVKYVTIC